MSDREPQSQPNPGQRRRRTSAVYVISVAAELAGMHPQTLRMYERKGLVEPERTDGGNRRYSDEDLALLDRIQRLTNDGLNLAGVKRVLELEAEIDLLRQRLDRADQRLQRAVEQVHDQYRRDLVPLNQNFVIVRQDPR